MSTMSISCPPKAALRTALWLLWTVIRHPRSSVTFYVGDDS